MAEVADHLVPRDGMTNSEIRFAGLDAIHGSPGAVVRFDIFDDDKRFVGTFSFDVAPQPEGTVDAVVAEGFRCMRDILRQWLYATDKLHQAYSKQIPDQPDQGEKEG